MSEFRVLAIVGPTATGKTALSIALAQQLNGEIISADSRQVYRGLNLGTGKVTTEEAQGVPHHLIDVADPAERFTVHDFVRLGHAAIADIAARGKVPIIAGGTGLYIDALLGRRLLDAPPPDPALRARIVTLDVTMLREELKRVDPERYARTDLKNRRRVERALEIALSKVRPCSARPCPVTPAYTVSWIGLTLPREELKERIRARLAARLAAGMLDEARTLLKHGVNVSRMEELGLEYRYMARHLAGALPYDDMVTQLEREIYQYAKRQLTWFKPNTAITWFDTTNPRLLDKVLTLVSHSLRAHQDSPSATFLP